jgi:16S rRNA C967 or C1407 C5-methylase (RsmB/RsmF family)
MWASDHHLSFDSYALYDRVLVDAECTSDGAFRHHVVRAASESVLREEERSRNLVRTYRTGEEVLETTRLQQALLERAWHLLKPGGLILYCTCSLLPAQNEQLVEALLDRFPAATLEPLDRLDSMPHIRSATLKHAVYFRGGNSIFASRIRKPT